jgi:hypothetical protein
VAAVAAAKLAAWRARRHCAVLCFSLLVNNATNTHIYYLVLDNNLSHTPSRTHKFRCQPASRPACLPACQPAKPASQPASQPACLPASQPACPGCLHNSACLPSHRRERLQLAAQPRVVLSLTRCAHTVAFYVDVVRIRVRATVVVLRQTPLFPQLFLCLSRACLGKMIVFIT